MSKELIFGVIATTISLISLGIAGYSLKLSIDSEVRSQQQFESAITSVLISEYDKDNNKLNLKTSEDSKLLSFGVFVFPEVFAIDSIEFSSPENDIGLTLIEKKVNELMKEEGYLIYKESPRKFKDVTVVMDFVIPLYAEYQSTYGGDSFISQSLYKLVFTCSIYEDLVLDKKLDIDRNCIYKTMVHDGRVSIENFYTFHWPWASDAQVSRKLKQELNRRIMLVLNGEWESLRPSVRYKDANK